MTDLYANTDRLFEIYCCLLKFNQYESDIFDYQQNIKSAFLGCIDNQELSALLTQASDCLDRSRENSQTILRCIDSINSVCEWCAEETNAIVSSIDLICPQSGAILTSENCVANESLTDTPTDIDGFKSTVHSIKEIIENDPTCKLAKIGIKECLAVISDLRITKYYKDGKVFLKGYKRSDHLTWRYNKSTYVAKQATNFSLLEKLNLIGDAVENISFAGEAIYNTWHNEENSTEDKIIDTATYGICSAASMALDVAATIAGNAVVAAVPIPVLNVVLGKATEYVIGTAAEVMRSEIVVNQVEDSMKNVVGAATAGVAAISQTAERLKNSETLGDAIANTLELVGSAVKAGCQVVSTVIDETIKTVGTVIAETASTIWSKISGLFKGR